MKHSLREWCESAWAILEEIPGGIAADLRAKWNAHASHDDVVVTFFGPYDSGKSSLLKRLLVDDGQPIPDWLTVSGRRETFEPKEVRVAGVVVRDTPGIAGGNELHESIAKEALLLSDVIVLVLPPQLVTSDRESLVAVFTGRSFGCSPAIAFAERGLPIVLSRMDEAGAMPRDDVQGYRELVERKRGELQALLKAEGGTDTAVAVHAVAADPFGLVGNAQPSGREEYDADRSWDGIGGLTDFLQSLAGQKEQLRHRAEVRFLGAELKGLHASLLALSSESRVASEAAANEATSHQLVQERLRALLGAARADLDRRIVEEVSAASRRGAADVNELRGVVLARCEDALRRWASEHDAGLEALVREADAEFQVRRSRPAWKKLGDVLGDAGAAPAAAGTAKEARKVVDKVQKAATILHRGFRDAQPVVIGMPLEKARQELQKLRQAATFEEYAKQAKRGTTRLKDAAHAAQARRAVLLDVGLDVALPAILELGGLLAEAWSESKAVEQRAKRREEVRKVIEESTTKLADRAWELWRDEGPSALEAALAQATESAAAAATSLRTEGEAIRDAASRVEGLLARLQQQA